MIIKGQLFGEEEPEGGKRGKGEGDLCVCINIIEIHICMKIAQ
jgi:hypothetical protein